MERGANTFPFHNLLPYSESNEGLFLYFLPSLNWIKEKSVETLAIRTFAIQKPKSQFTVLQFLNQKRRSKAPVIWKSHPAKIHNMNANKGPYPPNSYPRNLM